MVYINPDDKREEDQIEGDDGNPKGIEVIFCEDRLAPVHARDDPSGTCRGVIQ